ncbi:MAG: response regulator [Alphaproteobacteria bacterium]
MPKKILIVEDNELNMKLFSDLLDAHGYETSQAREGLKAISMAKEVKPDLILMDIQLPEVSGLEVTKWIKDDEELANIPIIAVTAFAMRGDEKRIRDGGCEDYISKPITITSFLSTIRKFVK